MLCGSLCSLVLGLGVCLYLGVARPAKDWPARVGFEGDPVRLPALGADGVPAKPGIDVVRPEDHARWRCPPGPPTFPASLWHRHLVCGEPIPLARADFERGAAFRALHDGDGHVDHWGV